MSETEHDYSGYSVDRAFTQAPAYLSKREQFALAAMHALIISKGNTNSESIWSSRDRIATIAYNIADVMLEHGKP